MKPARVVIDWRKPGGKKPAGVINCARPSRYGNPFAVDKYGRSEAVRLFRQHLANMDQKQRAEYLQPLRSARGLACYCKPSQACHVDVILDYLKHE